MTTTLERWVFPALLVVALVLPCVALCNDLADPQKALPEASVVVAGWILALVAGLAAALRGQGPLWAGQRSWCAWALVGFAGWAMLRATWAPAYLGAWSYGQTVTGFVLFFLAVRAWLQGRPEGRTVAFGALAGILGLESFIYVLESAQVAFPGMAGGESPLAQALQVLRLAGARDVVTPSGTFGNENYFAEFLALVVPVTLGWAMGLRRRAAIAIGVLGAVAFFIMIKTGCRAAFLGAMVGAPVAALLTFGLDAWKPRAWLATPRGRLLSYAAAAVLAFALIFGGQTMGSKFAPGQAASTFDLAPRLVSGQVAVDMWRKRPLDGLGLGAYATGYVEQVLVTTGGAVPKELTDGRFMQAHNDALQGLAELGLIGALLALAAFIMGLREVRTHDANTRWERFGIAWGLVALFVASMFGFPMHIPVTSMALMVVAALATARPLAEGSRTNMGLAIATALVFGAGSVLAYRGVAAPMVQASYYQRLAEAAFTAGDPSTASSLYALAYSHERFKPTALYGWMRALQGAGRDAEAIALQDAHPNEGLGVDSYALRGLALERLGKREEATAAFKRVMAYYQPANTNYRVAEQGLDRLEGRR